MTYHFQWECGGIDASRKTDTFPVDENLRIPHCHGEYEILYVVSGEGTYLVEGSEYALCPGTLMLFRPMEYHYVRLTGGDTYDRYVLHFPASALAPDAAKLLPMMEARGEEKGSRFYPASAVSHTLAAAFDRLPGAEKIPADKRAVYAQMLLSEIIVLLSTVDSSRLAPDNREIAVRVLQYINDHLDEDMTLDDVARRFFVSKYYLCRAFRKRNGVSIHGYITHKRVMYAKQLMEGGESASAAAYRVGFGDYSAFYRAYVKIVGQTPVACVRTKENQNP